MLLVGGVNDGGAADFSIFLSISVETPAADFIVTDDIFHEKNSIAEL